MSLVSDLMRVKLASLTVLTVFSLVACQAGAPPPAPPPAGKPTAQVALTPATQVVPTPVAPTPTTQVAPTAAAKVPAPAKPTPVPLKQISIGTVTTAAIVLPLFYAQEKGIFQRYGLDATIQLIPAGSSPLAALSSDQVQVLFISAEGIAANLSGADFVYFFTLLPAPPLSLYSKADITEFSQLRGRKIGVGSRNGSDENLVLFGLQNASMPVEAVEIFYTGSLANSWPALLSGGVDAAVLSPPTSFQAEAQGFRELLNGPATGWTYMSTSVWTTRSYASQNREVLLSFAKAIIEATATIKKDKATAIEVLAKPTRIEDKLLLERTYERIAPLFLRVPLAPTSAVRGALADLSKTVPAAATADPTSFVDDRIVRELDASGFIRQMYGS